MKTQFYLCLILFCCFFTGLAQHYQFSQYYAAPTYLNPAFTGANVCSRFTLNYRKQWNGIPGAFTTYQAAVDHSLRKYKSGVGLQLFKDNAGLGNLNTTAVNLLYAYEARLSKKVMGRGGISIGTVQRKIDYSALVMADQIARGNAAYSLEGFSDTRANYFDIGTGILVYSRSLWGGLALSHLNTPDQSLLNGTSPLPTELKLHGGYKHMLEEAQVQDKKGAYNNSITFTMNYKKQKKFNQIDAGVYYSKNLFVLGIWYRGIPLFKPSESYANNDAVIVLAGINMQRYTLGYSYDFTISKLTHVASKGAHELSMSFQMCNLKKSKKKKNILISCPKF